MPDSTFDAHVTPESFVLVSWTHTYACTKDRHVQRALDLLIQVPQTTPATKSRIKHDSAVVSCKKRPEHHERLRRCKALKQEPDKPSPTHGDDCGLLTLSCCRLSLRRIDAITAYHDQKSKDDGLSFLSHFRPMSFPSEEVLGLPTHFSFTFLSCFHLMFPMEQSQRRNIDGVDYDGDA